MEWDYRRRFAYLKGNVTGSKAAFLSAVAG